MSRLIVDASVAVKWVLAEEFSDFARRLIHPGFDLVVPDLLFIEACNVLWKRVRRGELEPNEADNLMQYLLDLEIPALDSQKYIVSALQIACLTGRTVYDSLYLALADSLDTQMVTADGAFRNAMVGQPLGARVLWIEDVGSADVQGTA